MNPALLAQIIASAEELIPLGVKLVNALKASGANVKSVEELLAEANANDDAIIAAAQKELNPPAQ
jgi:hypothetical protein